MKIIRNGRENNNATQEITCQECNSVLEITPQDLGSVNSDRDGSYYNITCPVCHRLLYISVNAIDQDMKKSRRIR